MESSPSSRSDLELVWKEIQADPAFDGLRATGANFVPGDGQCVTPPVAFIGEAPGATEDEQRRPFVGQAGRLLEQLIQEELQMTRSDVWITNVIKYRPAGNRTPSWAEQVAAKPHLRAELRIVRPRVIVTLGAVPLALVRQEPITRVHGQPVGRGRWIWLSMFHPAYLLRRRDLIPAAREDFAQLRRLLSHDRPEG